MNVKRIEHVAIAVADLDAGRAFWEGVLGIRCEEVEDFASARVRVALYPVGDSMVELLCGTTPESPYAREVHERWTIWTRRSPNCARRGSSSATRRPGRDTRAAASRSWTRRARGRSWSSSSSCRRGPERAAAGAERLAVVIDGGV